MADVSVGSGKHRASGVGEVAGKAGDAVSCQQLVVEHLEHDRRGAVAGRERTEDAA